MKIWAALKNKYTLKDYGIYNRNFLQLLHIDLWLTLALLLTACYGFVILYSATNGNTSVVKQQAIHMAFAFLIMFMFAQIPPLTYRRLAPWIYFVFIFLLLVVLITGHINKGAQRWINVGFFHFQPSELLKIAIPIFLASQFCKTPLPVTFKSLVLGVVIILIPVALTIKQPDLGTAILLAIAGFSVLFLAGLSFRIIALLGVLGLLLMPVFWHFMHEYQQERVLTFLNPERDPLGAGYHIIQSKIAIGSGGLFGKGFLLGSQVHLKFLPENTTDFIFGVCAEEFGLVGCALLITCYILIVLRGFYIALESKDTFTRLLAGSLTVTFFFSFFINIGMVTGILPVVGIPLPLISYGGTSLLTMLAGFGILMSIHTHKSGAKR